MTLVSLLVPLLMGLYGRPISGWPALAAMVMGIGLWLLHFALGLHDPEAGWGEWFLVGLPSLGGLKLPGALSMTACSLAAYLFVDGAIRLSARGADR